MKTLGLLVLALALGGLACSSSSTGNDGGLPDGEIPDGNGGCTASSQCGPEEICSHDGVCIPLGTCAVDEDCRTGERCVNGECYPGDANPCVDDSDCDPDHFCGVNGICIMDGHCVSDLDWPESNAFCSYTRVCLPEGECAGPTDCPAGQHCDQGVCRPEDECGAEAFGATAVPSNLLIVLDRSCSMRNRVNDVRKWVSAVEAIIKITTDFKDQIRFGLTLFPDTVTPRCEQSEFPFQVAPGNEQGIQDLLTAALDTADQYWPDGPCVTNIDSAVQQAGTDPGLDDPERSSFIMLITDGKQFGCSEAGGDAGTNQMLADYYQNRDIGTYVVGFGGAVSATDLNSFAESGGYPRDDPAEKYFQADDQAELEAALLAIGAATLGCEYKLEQTPEDIALLFVFFNDTDEILRDETHTDGWDYDETTGILTFYGPACDRIRSGQVTDIDIVYGCAGPVVD